MEKPFAVEKDVLPPVSLSPAQGQRRWSIQLKDHRNILATGDGVLLQIALLMGLYLGAGLSSWEFTLSLTLEYLPWFVGITAFYFLFATAYDSYRPKIATDPIHSLFAILKTMISIVLLYALIYFFSPVYTLPRHFVVFTALGIAPVLLVLWRRVYVRLFDKATFKRRVLVIGAGWAGQTIVKTMRDFAPSHFEFVGFVDDDPEKQEQRYLGLSVIGPTTELVTLTRQLGVSEVILAVNRDMQGALLSNLLACYEQGVRVSNMADLYEHLTNRVPVEHIGDNWFVVLPLENNGQNLSYRALKRLFDVTISLVGLLLFALVFPFVALAIKLDSAGPIFYRQKRVGLTGRVFELVKLRSMVTDAEGDGQARWAEKYDTRVTRIGQFLRRTRLDELPQLLNVLRGEMSFVGPRPERPEFVAELEKSIPFYRTRLTVKPGLTGWAQVNYDYARSAHDALEKLRYDLFYIKHQSIHLDLVILLKTVGTVLMLKGS